MPTNSLLPSVVGNVVAQRQRLSQVRQRIGLEPSPQALRELAPSPPTGPANVKSAATKAVQGEPELEFQLPPEKNAQMLTKVAQFIDRMPPPQQPQAAPSAAPTREGAQVLDDPKAKQAMAPMTHFFRQHGRLPTVHELASLNAAMVLEQQLGRPPTQTEVQLFLAKAPR